MHLYNENDDNMRSKLTEHDFGMVPGAWEDMESRLNQVGTGSAVGSASWSAWFIIGAMVVATSIGILSYQWQLPAKFELQPMAEAQEAAIEVLPQAAIPTEKETEAPSLKPHQLAQAAASSKPAEQPIAKIDNTVAELQASNKASKANQPITATSTAVDNADKTKEEVKATDAQEQVPGVAPESNEPADGQRKTEVAEEQNNKIVYRRRTEVIHRFSESTLKWKPTELPTILSTRIQHNQQQILIDTPLIILENPFLTKKKDISYGVSAGLNSKIYGNGGNFSVAPVVGTFIRKSLDKQYAIQADLQYKLLLQQNQADLFATSKQPEALSMHVDVDPSAATSFEERTAKVYSIKRMHMFELPVAMIYKVHPKHEVSVGFKASYLFGVETASEVINGYSLKALGFSSLDLGALAGYEVALNDHLSLGIFYNVGFMNLARNTSVRADELGSSQTTSYQLNAEEIQQALDKGDQMLPISVNDTEQIFLQTPRNLYNSDLRILLRYFL